MKNLYMDGNAGRKGNEPNTGTQGTHGAYFRGTPSALLIGAFLLLYNQNNEIPAAIANKTIEASSILKCN